MKNAQSGGLLSFLLQSIAVGLAIAFIIVYFFPGLQLPGTTSPGNIDASQGPASYKYAVSAAAASVVNVYATTVRKSKPHPLFQDPLFRRFFGKPTPETRRDNSLGSGVIIGVQGYVLTNAHVVKAADEILITLTDGRQAKAEIIGMDE